MSFNVLFLSLLGASFLEKIHRGYTDGQLCFFWEHEGWRRKAEGPQEGKEAPRQNELQVTHPFSLPFWIISLCSSVSPSPSSQRQGGQNCARTFLWVTRRWKADVMCILAVHKIILMSLIYDHFLWLGSKTANRCLGAQLSPVKSFPPNCCHGIAKPEAFLGVQDVC